MRSKAPYQKTDPPREWARKRILKLEEEVAGLKIALDEQSELIKALIDKPARVEIRDTTCYTS